MLSQPRQQFGTGVADSPIAVHSRKKKTDVLKQPIRLPERLADLLNDLQRTDSHERARELLRELADTLFPKELDPDLRLALGALRNAFFRAEDARFWKTDPDAAAATAAEIVPPMRTSTPSERPKAGATKQQAKTAHRKSKKAN